MEKFKIELNYDMVDNITRANLVDMLDTLNKEIEHLEERAEDEGSSFPDFLKVDLHDSRRHKKDVEAVLRYMSVQSDLEPFGLSHLCDY